MLNIIKEIIEDRIKNIHTAFIGKVIQLNGNCAKIQPLTYSQNIHSENYEQAAITAVVPENIKSQVKEITYVTNVSYTSSGGLNVKKETAEILVPAEIAAGDIVYVGICERDISEAVNGALAIPSGRMHDMNDAVILKVL